MTKKSIILAAIALCSVAGASAQTYYDALRFSENNYYGTARTIGMGNAMTAVGGDIGSVVFNPAGSAVNNWSQIVFTPNVSLYASSAGYDPCPSGSLALGQNTDTRSRFTMPSFGLTTNFKTGRRSGIKSYTFGFIGSATANFTDRVSAGAENNRSTMQGALAAEATGYSSSILNEAAYHTGQAPWASIVGYKSGMISTYGARDDEYIGSSEVLFNENGEDVITPGGYLKQAYGHQSSGNKYDLLLNFGMNVSDVFYIGFNLGMVSLTYNYDKYFKEAAIDPRDFEIEFDNGTTCFNDARFREHYDADGSGVYGKFGFIARPFGGLRIGAAIQTPTSTTITEHWRYAGDCNFTDSGYNASETSDLGEYEYRLVSPYRVNAGLAYTIGSVALLSADYEMTDFSTMKFREIGTNDHSGFNAVNADIKDFTGIAHSIRVGAEVKPTPEFAIRAGYNITTSPERYFENNVKMTPKSYNQSAAFGVGFSSNGSFFADAALRGRFWKEYIYPYADYIDGTPSPEISNNSRLWDIVMTIGWRF